MLNSQTRKLSTHFSSHAGSERCLQNMSKAVGNYCQKVGHSAMLSRFLAPEQIINDKPLFTPGE